MKAFQVIDKIWSWILKVISALLAFVMFALVCTTTWQVLSRYITSGSPQMWPTDIASYGLVFLTYMGMGILVRGDGHTRVDIVYTHLPDVGKHILDVVMDLIGVATVWVMAYFTLKLDINYAVKNTFLIGSVFNVPKYLMFSFIPIGLVITGVEYVRRLVLDILALRSSLSKTER